jgi:6-phosphogluconolactonase
MQNAKCKMKNTKQFGSAEVQVLEGLDDLSRAAASEVVQQARQAIQERGQFVIALSGGSTPKSLFSLLADDSSFRTEVPWDKIHFFWGDERHVPPDHPESNYRMAHDAMLSKVPIPSENVHRIKSENPDAQQVAEEYEETVRTFFRLRTGEFPRFDLVLLGLGRDGHTASLFPGTKALHERSRLAVANWVEKFHTHRITMTLPVLNQAAFVLFLVSGEEKAETLRQVLEEKERKTPFPSQLIRPTHGRLLWLVDRAAGRLL